MQRLEDQIGHPLFDKQGRQKRLTRMGTSCSITRATCSRSTTRRCAACSRAARGQPAHRRAARRGRHHAANAADQVARTSPLLQLDIHVGRSPFLMESLKAERST
jgi:DNA-binding transcriptional LysR family regulator